MSNHRRRQSGVLPPVRPDSEPPLPRIPSSHPPPHSLFASAVPSSADPVLLAERILPLLSPCARLRSLDPGSVDWARAADLIIALHTAEVHLVTDRVLTEVGPSALDVVDALVGILRASVHPHSGSPTLRDRAFQALVAWGKELRRHA